MTSVRSSCVGHAANARSGADVGLEAAVHRQAAPVGVVARLQRRLLVVLLGADGVGDQRVPAVGADDHAGVLGDGLAALAVAADAGDAAVLDDDVLDGESLADLGAGLGGGIDEQLVQHGPPRGVGARALVGPGRAGDARRVRSRTRTCRSVGSRSRRSRSSRPHRSSAATPGGWTRCVEIVSLGNVARSTTRTR